MRWPAAVAAFFAMCIGQPVGEARSESVLDRIARTGTFVAGTRADAAPFAFRGDSGELQGFSVDLLKQIDRALDEHLGKPVDMRLDVVTSQSRIPAIEGDEIDIECGITTPTWTREKLVDFSIPFFENGTRILALRGSARSVQDLDARKVGVSQGSTTLDILHEVVPGIMPVEVADMNAGLDMLERGELAGLANIGIVLRGLIEKNARKSQFLLLPRTGALSYESMACMLPQDDSPWRDFVNRTLSEMLDGVDEYRGTYYAIYDRWFGTSGYVFYPLDREVAERLAGARTWLE
jgi:polar amino acid transport system substrate-binding protein